MELHLFLHEDVSRVRMKDVVEGEGVAVEGALVEKVTWEEFKWPVLKTQIQTKEEIWWEHRLGCSRCCHVTAF